MEVEPSENGARTRIFVFAGELSAEGVRDAEGAVTMGKTASRCRSLHDHVGIGRRYRERKDVANRSPRKNGQCSRLEKVMFEAADPDVFGWYIKNYGPEVNLFVDHSQIVQLECLRSEIWGTHSLWGRVLTYKEK